MAEAEAAILHGYELRLLRCTLSSPPCDTPSSSNPHIEPRHRLSPLHSSIDGILTFIETGDYLGALSSDAARLVFGLTEFEYSDSVESADFVYSELIDRVESFVVDDLIDEEEKACRVVMVMCVSIAAFFWFTQTNFTGPCEELRKSPVPFRVSESTELVEWENWARNQLMSAGSDLLGKFSNLQYIVLAKMLLMRIKDLLFGTTVSTIYSIGSVPWWLARLLLIHQRILDHRASQLFDLLHVFMAEAVHHFGSMEKVRSYWDAKLEEQEVSSIVSMIHLEAGVIEYIYGRVDSCKLHFESAERAAGLQLSVTGVKGFRTVHQEEPKQQLVLVAKTSSSSSVANRSPRGTSVQSHESAFHEELDIYITPKLLDGSDESGAEGQCNNDAGVASLKPIEQAVILAQCLLIENRSRHDGMQRWEMAPYIEAIDSQESTYYSLQSYCDVMRVRWESTRSRTKGRALEMMNKLIESVSKSAFEVSKRIPLYYSTYNPTLPALRKEYGELLVSCGLTGEAITVFESLELWDNLIYCNCLLGKKAAAVSLIKTRLSESPNDPKLWCSLGDVTKDDACYEKALEVSGNKSVRAKSALARSAYNRGDYEASKTLWLSALALNSLYPNGWFALGAAALKARDVDKALDAFIRAVHLDPDNGEALNNIACLHMIKKRSKESFVAFKEALKLKRDSWQMWENYSHVAMDVGNIRQALEATEKVLNMTKNKKIDVVLLERIMLDLERSSEITSATSDLPSTDNGFRDNTSEYSEDPSEITSLTIDPSSTDNGSPADSSEYSEDRSGNMRQSVMKSQNDFLVELLGKILQQIIKVESTAEIWGLYARWQKIKGDLTMCSEALLKQVRSYQGSDLWKDVERFKKFARASVELSKVYMELASSTGSRRELFSAEMNLKNAVKQASANFSETQELRNLEACLDQVRTKLQSFELST